MIYFDQAATTRVKPDCVIAAVTQAMCTMGNSGRAVHGGSLDASRSIYEAREKAAAFFGCPKARNVVFTSNATESLNIALFGLLGPGDHVIATDLEHNSVLRPLYQLERQGVEVSFLPADCLGNVQPEQLKELI